jgi:hypothetical protein
MSVKPVMSLDDAFDDFGFSAVSEDELKVLEKQLQRQVSEKSKELEEIEKTYKGKLEQLYRAVIPLLKNLAKDSDKEYIYWPNRTEKMQEFIKKVESIVND